MIKNMKPDKKLLKKVDYTLLDESATQIDIDKLIKRAIELEVYSICIYPKWVKYCYEQLKNSDIKVCTVIDFPNGDSTHKKRIEDVKLVIADGAQEIDIVFPYKEMKEVGISLSFNIKNIKELNEIQTLCSLNKVLLKVIIESGELNELELINAVGCCCIVGVDFIKTSTGKVKIGARLKDVKLIKECIDSYEWSVKSKIKASGGIRTYEDMIYFDPYVDRFGISCKSIDEIYK